MKNLAGIAFLKRLAAAAPMFMAASFLFMSASGCGDRHVGSEIGNPTIAGTIKNPDGTPAVGATVTLRTKDYLATGIGEGLIRTGIDPGIILAKRGRGLFKAEVETDAKGYFRIDSVDTGSYRLVVTTADEDGLQVELDVDSANQLIELKPDPIQPTAAITGTLRLSDPTAGQYIAFVRGAERAVLVDRATGAFTLPNVPAGSYTVYFGCLDAGCLSQDVPKVAVAAGQNTVMDTVSLGTFTTEKYSAWKNSMRISFHAASAGVDETVDGFPLLVRLDADNFPFAGAAPQGRDIRFADTLGNNLHLEIERWDSAGKRAEVWVRIPTVAAGPDSQVIVMYWGNPAAAAYSSGVEVFPRAEGFRGVWHLAENAGSAANGYWDASANSNHGTGISHPAQAPGPSGFGQSFDGKAHITVEEDSTLHADSALTIELWARFYDLGAFRRLVSKAFSSGRYPWTEYDIESDTTGKRIAMVVGLRDSAYSARSSREIAVGQWTHITGTYDGSEIKIYMDGVLEGAVERKGAIADHGQGLIIGKYEHDAASNFNGALDEVRVTAKARPSSWIRLSYENQKPGSALLKYAAPKAQ